MHAVKKAHSISKRRKYGLTLALILAIPALFSLELLYGSVSLSLREIVLSIVGSDTASPQAYSILWESRIPRALTALAGGAGLALAGMLMQTLFRNPLAGPSILGISSGASLAVALLVMGQGAWAAGIIPSSASVALAAMCGGIGILAIVLSASVRLGNTNSLLLFGILIGHFVSSIESVLQHRSEAGALRSFVVWGMGRFSDTDLSISLWMLAAMIAGAILSGLIANRLNLFLLGETYAASMGLRLGQFRWMVVGITGLLAGIITAFCGPIAFIGLAVPHLARMLLGTSNHRVILFPLLLIGAGIGLFSDLISRYFEIPLNAVTSLIGAPVVISILFQSGKKRSVL